MGNNMFILKVSNQWYSATLEIKFRSIIISLFINDLIELSFLLDDCNPCSNTYHPFLFPNYYPFSCIGLPSCFDAEFWFSIKVIGAKSNWGLTPQNNEFWGYHRHPSIMQACSWLLFSEVLSRSMVIVVTKYFVMFLDSHGICNRKTQSHLSLVKWMKTNHD